MLLQLLSSNSRVLVSSSIPSFFLPHNIFGGNSLHERHHEQNGQSQSTMFNLLNPSLLSPNLTHRRKAFIFVSGSTGKWRKYVRFEEKTKTLLYTMSVCHAMQRTIHNKECCFLHFATSAAGKKSYIVLDPKFVSTINWLQSKLQ